MKKQGLRLSVLAVATMFMCGLIGSGTSALAQSGDASIRQFDDGSCSNRTLRGKYAFSGCSNSQRRTSALWNVAAHRVVLS